MDQELINKFQENIDKSGDCWVWTGFLNKRKSPVIRANFTEYSPARISAELAGITLPNKPIQFKCKNNLCVNPDHFICGDETRFWSKVKIIPDSCWEWQAGKDKNHYGKFNITIDGSLKHIRAHRYSYILKYGNISDNICVCHICDNPSCVNPDHLFLGTNAENTQDRVIKNRSAKGEKIAASKLTEKDIYEIRAGNNVRQLVSKFGVAESTIHYVRSRKSWKHVK